jgi:hypothetical protein
MKIKPTGLKGSDKIQRIQNLMGKLSPINESTENSSLEHVKYGADGVAYGIVRENHTYFIKTSDKNDGKLSASDFEYIGGLQNKLNESYKSYEEALKHLNMRFKDLNEFYNIRENIDLFKSDLLFEGVKKEGIQNEQDDTKFKLKIDAPVETPTPMDSETPEVTDVPTEEIPDMSTEPTDMEGDEEDSEDLEKDIQRLTGKIGQKMRELDEPNPELEKYVINSIMSALDVDSMDEDFKEDLISKLEGEEESTKDEESSEEKPSEEDTTENEPTEEPAGEPMEEPVEETKVKSESRIISKKTLMENLKSKKILKNKLKKTIKENSLDEYFYFDEESEEGYELPKKLSKRMNNKDTFYGKFRDQDDEWIGNVTHKGGKLDDTNDWDEEEFEDYEEFSKKYPDNTWFDRNPERSKMMFKSYKDKFGPLSIRKKSKMDDEMLDEMEKMDVFSNPAELTNSISTLKKGSYGVKDPKTGQIKSFVVNEDEDENIYEIELDEDWMEEGNKFTDMLRKTKKGDRFKINGRSYRDTSNYDDLDEDFEEEFEMEDEVKPLHKKPFDLTSIKKRSKFNQELEEDLEMFDRRDMDRNDISDDLEIKSDKPTIAPPPVKTPTKTPRRDRPFKPQIKPKIQPKGYRD